MAPDLDPFGGQGAPCASRVLRAGSSPYIVRTEKHITDLLHVRIDARRMFDQNNDKTQPEGLQDLARQ